MKIGEWITKDGKILKIKDMETSHIENCINMMDRQICKAINRSYDGEIYVPNDFEAKYFELNEELNKRYNNTLSDIQDR